MNHVLESFREQRAEQVATMDAILGQVEGRDLVDAERGLLEAARGRIAELDAQIEPLAAFRHELARAHGDGSIVAPSSADRVPARRADGIDRAPQYRSAGAFVVDYLAARGIGSDGVRDEAAAARVYQARAAGDQTTSSTPGLLPTPVVGGVVNLIDANRPLITSLGGALGLGGIPGTTFSRPKITTHTLAGKQAAEKAALPTRGMTVAAIPFTKETHGGTVDISRQDIDWTSPAAWDILVKDLADVYSLETETTVAAAFVTAATGTKPVLPATPVLADWTKALYTAAMHSYSAGGRMPDRIWCSLDAWAALGSLVDVARPAFPSSGNLDTAAGSSALGTFSGDVLGLPRIVVPTFPAKTIIVGPAALFEVYEDVIGLLSVIEPSILGVQVAYGGYIAFGTLAAPAFVPVDASAVTNLPTMDVLDAGDGDGDADDANGGTKAKK